MGFPVRTIVRSFPRPFCRTAIAVESPLFELVAGIRTRKIFILLSCLTGGVPTAACSQHTGVATAQASDDTDLQTVLDLSADIRSVSTGGLWTYRGREGWLRFVVTGGGVEHYSTNLYIQWFAQAQDGSEIELLDTVPVRELNGSPIEPPVMTRFTFTSPECTDKTACTEATIKAFDIRQGGERRFSLFLEQGPGLYRLELH
jgi:hypothetical protein